MNAPTRLQSWKTLQQEYQRIHPVHMRELFATDPERFDRYSLKLNDILFDYSKNRIDGPVMDALLGLARESDLEGWRERMFQGERINHTEHRPVLHTALRNFSGEPVLVDGVDVMPEVHSELARVRELAEAIRSRRWRGATDQPITDVVNLGIGGSHLGPQMAVEALKPYAIHDLNIHFVNNIDENQINNTLERLVPETTLFIIASKSFTTQETMINADTARQWLLERIGDEAKLAHHMVAVSSNTEAAVAYGVGRENVFRMWDWVGGRYSMWSAIGLALVIAIGPDNFEELLRGAWEADRHFREAPLERNIPVVMGLLGVWYNNFFGAESCAVLPYDQNMHRFPAYLQQADMESNGKGVDRNGRPVEWQTGPVVFGEIGNAGQHAFYQLLHQGTKLVPADMLAPVSNLRCIARHHRALMSNILAQAEALMKGKTEEEVREELTAAGLSEDEIRFLLPYKVFPGNRPTNTFLFYTLDPKTLGTLVALYEHKIFVQGVIWNINSFDQWGVELGKVLAKNILEEIDEGRPVDSHDTSTNGLINYYLGLRPGRS